jgi:hypothetical protein
MHISTSWSAITVLVGFLMGCASTTTTTTRPGTSPGDPALPSWLLPTDACPADVVSAVEVPMAPFEGMCEPALESCMRRCEAQDAVACYAAALHIQHSHARPQLSEALFLRACQLGISSGCTNRAAGILKLEPGRAGGDVCAARTFEISCNRHDPWGCTMYGLLLSIGKGVRQDVDQALAVLPGGCSAGPDDAACVAAQDLIHRLQPLPAEPVPE